MCERTHCGAHQRCEQVLQRPRVRFRQFLVHRKINPKVLENPIKIDLGTATERTHRVRNHNSHRLYIAAHPRIGKPVGAVT